MNVERAERIFKDWKKYTEINDKLGKVFNSIPESFLPYPKQILLDALEVTAKIYHDSGDLKTAEAIQISLVTIHMSYKDDEEAMRDMSKMLMLMIDNPGLMEAKLALLERTTISWAKLKKPSP